MYDDYKGNSSQFNSKRTKTYLCLMANAPLFQHAGVLFSLVLQLGPEEGAVVAQLVVLRPVLLCLLKMKS